MVAATVVIADTNARLGQGSGRNVPRLLLLGFPSSDCLTVILTLILTVGILPAPIVCAEQAFSCEAEFALETRRGEILLTLTPPALTLTLLGGCS